jgi:hypothetical protein
VPEQNHEAPLFFSHAGFLVGPQFFDEGLFVEVGRRGRFLNFSVSTRASLL